MTSVDAPARTERELAADLLVHLMVEGILHRNQRGVATAALGLVFADVEEAWERRRRTGFVAFDGTRAEPSGSERHRRANTFTERHKRAYPEPGKRRCARCKETKPLEDFPFKNRSRNIRHSYCIPCNTEQQRERRLTVSKKKALNAVGLTFVITPADPLGTLACLDCGVPFQVGDEVHGETALRHTICPT